jgi:hypothetical protein
MLEGSRSKLRGIISSSGHPPRIAGRLVALGIPWHESDLSRVERSDHMLVRCSVVGRDGPTMLVRPVSTDHPAFETFSPDV